MRVGVVEGNANEGRVSEFEKHQTPVEWNRFVEILAPYAKTAEGFGVAVSGPVADHARVIKGPNIPWLEGRNVRQELELALGQRVVVSNDMEAATAGEMARGVLKGYSWAIFDTISTGWGGNLVLDGKRVDSEPGHANVTFNSPYRCGSGHVGCLEALYSGSGMERRIAEHLSRPFIPKTGSTEIWDAFHDAVDREVDWA
jgi:predicted NBD/HSP70 family sugar kinase